VDLKYDYVVRTVTLTRVPSPIQVKFVGLTNLSEPILVGQESSLTLDASDSLDLDNPFDSRKDYTYIWICPVYMSCQGRQKLVIKREEREEASLNKVGSVFRVGLQVKSAKKESKGITYISVRIVKQDYSKCLSVGLEGAEANVL
jgi:hypothetical protein